MKQKIIAIACLIFLFYSPAVSQSKDGYSTGAYTEVGAEDGYLDRVSDWLATVGKTREEKILIKTQRRAARKRAEALKNIYSQKKAE